MSDRELVVLDMEGREMARMALGSDPVTVGRAEGNTIVVADTLASRFHARIEFCDDGYEVIDRGSKNGTIVNGTVAPRCRLEPGDELLIGETTLRYEVVGDVAPPRTVLPVEPAPRTAQPASRAVQPVEAGPRVTAEVVLCERPGSPVIPASELAAARGAPLRDPSFPEPLPPPGTLDALAAFAESLASIPHELSSLEDVAGRLLSLIECERATVLIVEEGTQKPLVQYSRTTTLSETAGGPADEVIAAALTTERPVCIRVPRAREVLSATLNATRHLLLVPVRSSERKLGLVALEREPDQPPFEDEELAMLRTAGAQVATFLRSVL